MGEHAKYGNFVNCCCDLVTGLQGLFVYRDIFLRLGFFWKHNFPFLVIIIVLSFFRKILGVLELLTNITSFHQKVLMLETKKKTTLAPKPLLPALEETNQLLSSLTVLVKSKENGVARRISSAEDDIASLRTSVQEISPVVKKCDDTMNSMMRKAMPKKDPALARLSGHIDNLSDSIRVNYISNYWLESIFECCHC